MAGAIRPQGTLLTSGTILGRDITIGGESLGAWDYPTDVSAGSVNPAETLIGSVSRPIRTARAARSPEEEAGAAGSPEEEAEDGS